MKYTIFIFFSWLLSSVVVAAKDGIQPSGSELGECSPVDLRSKLGSPRDQGETGWCYAHTAADLISFRIQKRVSAFDIATTYSFTDLFVYGKDSEQTSKFLSLNPDAEPRWRDNRDSQKDQLNDGVVECFQSGYYQYGGLDESAIFLGNSRGFCADQNLPRTPAQIEAAAKEILDLTEPRGLKSISSDSPGGRQGSAYFWKVVSQWIGRKCPERIQSPRFLMSASKYVTAGVSDFVKKYPTSKDRKQIHDELFGIIDSELSQREPISIGYSAFDIYASDSKIMRQIRAGNRMTSHVSRISSLQRIAAIGGAPNSSRCIPVKAEPSDDDALGDHASLIVARRKQNGVCQYFVRNSFGANCKDYRPELVSRCEAIHGGAWLTRDELSTVYSLVWMP